MAFTPTEEAGLRIIFNSFIAAGYNSAEQVEGMLHRLRLEQELRALESQRTNMQASEDVQNQAFSEAMISNQAEITAKQAEIDAL